MSDENDRARDPARIERGLRTVRAGHGANCSSIGSVIDILFASATVGSALFAAIAAALAREDVTEVKANPNPNPNPNPTEGDG